VHQRAAISANAQENSVLTYHGDASRLEQEIASASIPDCKSLDYRPMTFGTHSSTVWYSQSEYTPPLMFVNFLIKSNDCLHQLRRSKSI
jgi:hypothetical protein